MSTSTHARGNTRRAAVQKAIPRKKRAATQAQVNGGLPTESLRHINSRAQLKQIAQRTDHDGSRTYLITPELAKWLLEFNSGNRRIATRRVERYQHLIESGLWLNTGEPIIVSDALILNEGQHRLLAIQNQGTPVPCDIRFGITRRAFEATGTGAMRTAANVVEISGDIPYSTNIAAAARLLIQYQMGLPSSRHAILGSQEIVSGVRRWETELITAAREAYRLGGQHGLRFAHASSIAFAVLALKQKNEELVKQFLEIVASGITDKAENPARRLYDRFRRDADEGRRHTGRQTSIERLALFIKAWNAWISNETMELRSLRWRSEGPQAEPFPVMENVRL